MPYKSMIKEMSRSVGAQARERGRRARRQVILLAPLIAAVLAAYRYREQVFGLDLPVRIATVIVFVVLAWAFARDLGRAAAPALFKRLEPGTAGTVGFLIRLFTLIVAVLVALRLSGLRPETLAVGGAITAVIFGLAAQQTLGNVIAGTVLLSARPFRVGDRIRLHSGGVAGQIEGTVSALGLLYTTLTAGENDVMVPNNVMLASAIVPLREPTAVDLRARLRPGVTPSEVQERLNVAVDTPIRGEPHITLEEVDGDEVVVRIEAVPEASSQGGRLADEVLAAVTDLTRDETADEEAQRLEGVGSR